MQHRCSDTHFGVHDDRGLIAAQRPPSRRASQCNPAPLSCDVYDHSAVLSSPPAARVALLDTDHIKSRASGYIWVGSDGKMARIPLCPIARFEHERVWAKRLFPVANR
jgi:hypothetical protein